MGNGYWGWVSGLWPLGVSGWVGYGHWGGRVGHDLSSSDLACGRQLQSPLMAL